MKILRLCALLALLALLPAWSTLLAQTDSGATIMGSVLDQAGKSIQGAAVTIKNEATATTRALVTDSDGHFSVSGLPAGIYTIETMAPGFARNSRTGVQFSANKTEDLSISMSVEALAQAVTVEAS